MSGSGAPSAIAQAHDARVAIIAATWHEEVMSGLIGGAERACAQVGVAAKIFRVPGSFELPLAAQHALANGFDAVSALGVIIRGGTPHFDYVCAAATEGLTRVALDTGSPIGFGLLTCDNEQQALDRAGLPDSREDKGYEATMAALLMLDTIDELRRRRP